MVAPAQDINRTIALAIAPVCHEVNRGLCEALGDNTQVRWDAAPEWQRESAIDGVLAIIEGRVKYPSQSHESWAASKLEQGWVYGDTKDVELKQHPCLVDFDELPLEQQLKDHLFFKTTEVLLGR